MPKYRKKPLIIEAEQWFPKKNPVATFAPSKELAWEGQVYFQGITPFHDREAYYIDTLEGTMEVTPGDYIITGIKGEKYPCKPDIFKESYDVIGEENRTKGTVAVDFDGVIHKYSKGYSDGTAYDEPMEGAEQGLKTLMERYNVFIMSTREPAQIWEWMNKWMPTITCEVMTPGFQFWNRSGVIGITNYKLPAIAYIDDRAVPFHNWELTMEPNYHKAVKKKEQNA